MQPTFDLTREPWIPAERLDGTVVELSTRDLLRDAHLLRGLADASPLVVAVLTRHLLAVLHRAYAGPRTMPEWTAIWNARQFDAARVAAYLESVASRMDLFHPTHPFAQTRGLREQFADYAVPIDELELVRSQWGGGRALFRHRPDDPPPTMPAARAARALLAHHAFATGGLVKKPGEPVAATAAPLVRAGVVILRGATLFETLVCNLLRYDPANGRPIPLGGEADSCSWEQPPPPERLNIASEPKRTYLGYLDLLTWISRRVELIHDGATVTHFINAVGKGLADTAPLDPMVTYRRDEERGLVSIGIDPRRGFWRDANALFEAGRRESSKYVRPQAIDLVAEAVLDEALPASKMYAVEVCGLSAEKSRVEAVRVERVNILARSFGDPAARTAVETSLEFAQSVVHAVQTALRTFARHALSPGRRDPDPKDVNELVRSFCADPDSKRKGDHCAAWSALGIEFDVFTRDLSRDPVAAANAFERQAQRVAREVFVSATNRPDTSGRWLKARALAERSLERHLPRVAPAAAGTSVSNEEARA